MSISCLYIVWSNSSHISYLYILYYCTTAMVTRKNDQSWSDTVNWVLRSLIQAELANITSSNVNHTNNNAHLTRMEWRHGVRLTANGTKFESNRARYHFVNFWPWIVRSIFPFVCKTLKYTKHDFGNYNCLQ